MTRRARSWTRVVLSCHVVAAFGCGQPDGVTQEPAPAVLENLIGGAESAGALFDQAVEEELAAPAPMPQMRAKKSARSEAKERAGGSPPRMESDDAEEAQAAAPMRSWFPETLLFEPAVLTGDDGHASVSMKVPDRLTTWRVLALAHSREGAQAGAVARFQGTLPTYVDLVVPPFVHAGDRLSLPVQVVNTTDTAVSGDLIVDVEGAASKGIRRAIDAPAGGSTTERLEIRTARPGTVVVRASLGGDDAVEQSIEVRPRGMPGSVDRGGTLAAVRTLALPLPDDVEPGSGRVRLSVFPGALALLRAELAAAPTRSSVADDAYLLLLTGRAPQLAKQLGADLDADELKRLRLIATQRALRHARAPDATTAALLAEAALAHSGSPVLARLGDRLSAQVATSQRPDGTFAGGDGWTLPRLLVATASSLRAVRAADTSPAGRQRAVRATLLASGAFERHGGRVEDAYTAAAIVASGAVEGARKEALLDLIVKAIQQRDDGTRVLPVPDVAQRPDGSRPTELEATALAALALRGQTIGAALLPDLGASLLAGYRGGRGFGDGHTNLVALAAVVELFQDALPAAIEITLLVDGEELVSGQLSAEKLREVTVLTAPLEGGGERSFEVRATPAVPGLGFLLDVRYTVPWPTAAGTPGLELDVERPKALVVGRPAEVSLNAAAPGGMALRIRHALPAGMRAETRSLDLLVVEGVITRFQLEEGVVVLDAPARAQGQALVVRYRVVPTFAGTLHAGASSVAPLYAPQRAVYAPSTSWSVGR